MLKRPRSLIGVALLLITPTLSFQIGCGERSSSGTPSGARPAPSAEILLLAAASTSDAVTELATLYESQTGVKVKITTGGSNALANQIMAGAPGEVFLSANVEWADAVMENELAVQSTPLLMNQLVIVVPRGNPASATSPTDLTSERVRWVAVAGEKVPAGIYAEQALRHAKVFDDLIARGRVARGQDVRMTLGYVETGEADAGIVYATDARASDKVDVVYTFPLDWHETIAYPLVLLKSRSNQEAGHQFFEFLCTDEAMRVFENHGFSSATVQAGARP